MFCQFNLRWHRLYKEDMTPKLIFLAPRWRTNGDIVVCSKVNFHVRFWFKGPFIKDVINQGRGVARRSFHLIILFKKSNDEGGRGSKTQKIDDVFYKRPLWFSAFTSLVPTILNHQPLAREMSTMNLATCTKKLT